MDFEIDSLSNIVWEKSLGGSESDNLNDLFLQADGSIIVIGSSRSSDGDVSRNFGLNDIWIAKLAFMTPINNSAPATSFNVFPNPSSGRLTVELMESDEYWTITVLDFSGRKIYTKYEARGVIDLGFFSRGMYNIEIESDRIYHSKKL